MYLLNHLMLNQKSRNANFTKSNTIAEKINEIKFTWELNVLLKASLRADNRYLMIFINSLGVSINRNYFSCFTEANTRYPSVNGTK